jgi:predicted nucleic acid-binding protein
MSPLAEIEAAAAALSPEEKSSKDTTDAHLVTLAQRHGVTLAIVDTLLIAKSWATGVAENPIAKHSTDH